MTPWARGVRAGMVCLYKAARGGWSFIAGCLLITPHPEGTRFRGSSLEGAVGGLPSGVVVEVPEVVLCGFTSSVAPLASIYGNDVEGAYAFAQAMRYS